MFKLPGSYLRAAAQHNFLIAVTASLASLSSYVIYHYQVNYILGIEVLFATFFTYTVQRFYGDDFANSDIPRWKLGSLIFSGIAIVVLAFFLSIAQIVLLALAGLLSFLYSFPAIPYRNSRKSLRQIPYLKIWVIVAVWILVICLVPLSELSAFETGDLLASKVVFVIQQGALIFALTIPFDIRDMKVDERDQKTIPMIIGVQRAIKLAKSVLWLSFFAAAVNFLMGFFDLEVVFIQLVITLLGLKLLGISERVQKSEFYLVGIDGLIALQAILFLLSYFS